MLSLRMILLFLWWQHLGGRGVSGAEIRLYGATMKSVNGYKLTSNDLLGVTFYTGLPALKDEKTLSQLQNQLGVNVVSFAQTASKMMLPDKYQDRVNCCGKTWQLKNWIKSGQACQKFSKSYTHGIWNAAFFRYKTSIKPFIYVRDVCAPDNYPTTSHCVKAIDPNTHDNGVPANSDGWWTELLSAYVTCALKTRPDLKYFHIWNEPNASFKKSGKDGAYYADFYKAVATRIKQEHPNVQLGGPVTWNFATWRGDWEDYWVTLMERTLKGSVKTLDFFDWHTYDHGPGAMHSEWDVGMACSEVLSLYSGFKYGKKMRSSITETNYVLKSGPNNWAPDHWRFRTISNAKQMIGLSHMPDKFDKRLIYDASATNYEFLGSIDYNANKILRRIQGKTLVDFEVVVPAKSQQANRQGTFFDENIMAQVVYDASKNEFIVVVINDGTAPNVVHLKDMEGMFLFSGYSEVARIESNQAVISPYKMSVNGPKTEAWITLPPKSIGVLFAKNKATGYPQKTLVSKQWANSNCIMQKNDCTDRRWPLNLCIEHTFQCNVWVGQTGTVRRAYVKLGMFWGAFEYKWSITGVFGGKNVLGVNNYVPVLRYNEFKLPAAEMGKKGSLQLSFKIAPINNGWIATSRFGSVSAVVDYV